MKFSPLFLLSLTTLTSVVGLSTPAQARDMTSQSKQALHQIYQSHNIDKGHWDLLVAVAKKGTVVRYNTSECSEAMGEGWSLAGYYGWENGKTEMVLCDHGGDTQALQSTIRHEVGHKIQDLKDGGRGDGRLSPFYNTKDGEFWAFYKSSNRINHEYVEEYNKGGQWADQATYHLEADAEVQQTETAQDLTTRLFQF